MKYNSIGEQLIAKAKELDPSYKPDKFNDMSEALDVILNNSGSGGEMIDLNEQIDSDKFTITQSGYNLIQQAYENNTLMGISFILNGLPIKCMFDYVDINLVTHTNVYCFKFGIGETYVIKIKSDLTIIPSPQNSFGDISSFEQVGYDETFVNSFVSDNKTYKIPYTLIYPNQDTYKNERLHFMNDTYSETTYKIPDLPSDASTKTCTLQTVNGVLTWTSEESIVNNLTLPQTAPSSQLIPSITTSNEQQNLTIGDGLAIENGVLKTTGSGGSGGEILELNATDSATLMNILDGNIPSGVQEFSTNYPLKDYNKVKISMEGMEGYYDVSNKLYIPNTQLQFDIFNNYSTSVSSSLDYVRVCITFYPGSTSYECYKFKLSLITA